MQKYISLFFSVLLFLTACKSEEVPKGVLKEKDMMNLLVDLHITDGAVYQIPQVPDSMFKYSSAKYVALFKRHHTTDAAYKTSLKYYSKQPERIQAMYNKIEVIIKAKVDSINKVTAADAKAASKAAAAQSQAPMLVKPKNLPLRPVLKKVN
jgi:hypothetical protein